MVSVLITLCIAAGTPPAADLIDISIRMPDGELSVGETHAFIIEYKFGEGYSASAGGIPAPIVQIQPAPSMELAGKVLTEHRELARNEYLKAPFERLLTESPTSIEFALTKKPSDDERVEINFITYAAENEGGNCWLVRKRFSLPLAAGSEATEGSAENSGWNKDKTLQIGDKATPFELPRADGSTVSLGGLLRQQAVVVTTYRAHW